MGPALTPFTVRGWGGGRIICVSKAFLCDPRMMTRSASPAMELSLDFS